MGGEIQPEVFGLGCRSTRERRGGRRVRTIGRGLGDWSSFACRGEYHLMLYGRASHEDIIYRHICIEEVSAEKLII